MNDLIKPVDTILQEIKKYDVLEKEYFDFLIEKGDHLHKVFKHTHIWRTDSQKESIINDLQFPTNHAKFHQAILEQKTQVDQLFYLVKDFEMKKLEIEELLCDIEELTDSKRDNIKRRKTEIDLKFKHYELDQMKIAIHYRMKEIMGWQNIQERLLSEMRETLTEEEIWNKNDYEIEAMFFLTLNNLHGIKQTTDSAEYSNLLSLAKFAIKQVKQMNKFESLLEKCTTMQLESLAFLGEIRIKPKEDVKEEVKEQVTE